MFNSRNSSDADKLRRIKTGSTTNDPTAPRQLKSARYPAMAFTAASNKNLISFYNDYPTSEIGGSDFMSRWAMYAETPLSDDARKSLYPQLRKVLNGKSEREAVEMLLNWVQTAFVYEYDDKFGDMTVLSLPTKHSIIHTATVRTVRYCFHVLCATLSGQMWCWCTIRGILPQP